MAACASPTVQVAKKHPKEYFSESAYGVKASPRVVTDLRHIPRGGGRELVGQPYKVAGKWYYPKEDRGYRRVGRASWYGSAFHGRLTANGEIYDTTRLTAAHPTMPLPSYARVTNLANGSSIIVRVNDRGPYHSNRVIDLSQKAATMLDYQHTGTADVRVEYVGRAPLEINDDAYLMASYQGSGAPDPYGQPASGVMIAMNGGTPTRRSPAPFPAPAPAVAMEQPQIQLASLTGQPASLNAQAARLTSMQQSSDPASLSDLAKYGTDVDPVLPLIGPIIADRPVLIGSFRGNRVTVTSLINSYAGEGMASTSVQAADGLLSSEAISTSWKHMDDDPGGISVRGEYVEVGTYADKAEATGIMAALANFGKVELSEVEGPAGRRIEVTARASDAKKTDKLLQAAWQAGASEAFVVRGESD